MWASPEIEHQVYLAEQARRAVRLERRRLVADLRDARPRRDWFARLRAWRRDARRTRIASVETACCALA